MEIQRLEQTLRIHLNDSLDADNFSRFTISQLERPVRMLITFDLGSISKLELLRFLSLIRPYGFDVSISVLSVTNLTRLTLSYDPPPARKLALNARSYDRSRRSK